MKAVAVSDLHLDFFQSQYEIDAFLESLKLPEVELLIIAGDLCEAGCRAFLPSLRKISSLFRDTIYVHGNHEYWGSSFSPQRLVPTDIVNIHELINGELRIDGIHFIGGTMWYPRTVAAEIHSILWNDFKYIGGLREWVWNESDKFRELLGATATEASVIVTHMLPSFISVPKQFRGSPTNCFYVSECLDIIEAFMPRMWIHGHTHESWDYNLGKTRIFCNPYGYKSVSENGFFRIQILDL